VNAALHAQGAATRRTIATTVVALVLGPAGADLIWAGDSRGYRLRDGRLQCLTRDHSLVQELLEAGDITEDEVEEHPQGNIILRAVGAEAELALDVVHCPLRPGDRVLLCSDGLYRALPRAELAALLASGGAAGLVAAALALHPRDNVTAVVVHLAA
jgi:protein phosphatase/serine/threonine-protein phosphatase Stp1